MQSCVIEIKSASIKKKKKKKKKSSKGGRSGTQGVGTAVCVIYACQLHMKIKVSYKQIRRFPSE